MGLVVSHWGRELVEMRILVPAQVLIWQAWEATLNQPPGGLVADPTTQELMR